jgi:predicted secreted protein
MTRDPAPRPATITRRRFLAVASAAVGGLAAPGWARAAGDGGARPSPRDALRLRVPRVTRNGAKVPIVVELDQPMTPAHHVRVIRVTNDSDPISAKGTFHFTPANGRVYLAYQARMHEGSSEVVATAECTVHGTVSARGAIEIPSGSGGCVAGGGDALGRTPGDDLHAPVIRIPALLERSALRRGEFFHVQVKLRHPNRTGLVFRDGRFTQESEPLHLDALEVFYDDEPVSRFALSSAISDDPLFTFGLVARGAGRIQVVVTNSRGQRFDAEHALRVA